MSGGAPSFREALGVVGRGPEEWKRFAIERQTLSGEWWQERLTLDGSGRATLSTLRSFGEASGEEIGRYEAVLGTDRLPNVLRALETCLAERAPARLEPSDLRILIDAVADGARFTRVAGGPPPQLEPYLDLMNELNRYARDLREHPLATLTLEFRLAAAPRHGTQEARVEVTFRNRGREGYWIRNPLAENEDEDGEHLRLLVAHVPYVEPGVTPLPPEPAGAPLFAAEESDRALLWIGPGESRAMAFVARLELEPGRHLMRVGFATYEGEDRLAGRHRLRGCAFSPEQSFEVEERP